MTRKKNGRHRDRNRSGWVWLEEYEHCGCSNVVNFRWELLGYCNVHATSTKRVTRIPKKPGMTMGWAH